MPKSYFPATQIWKVEFPFLPSDLEQMRTLPQATLDQPWKTAALTAAALCVAHGAGHGDRHAELAARPAALDCVRHTVHTRQAAR